ncbi:Dyp-type peroxidase [Streptoalloteichus hindustanus]|uniref:Dyp-type peroxidase n=1 Tax=Streptoalloteichus hindustanus TaxID=2017 RepID=UPI000A7DFD50|nr:Dyp-type peroxidase [Streptoalloteichus hindustanus]
MTEIGRRGFLAAIAVAGLAGCTTAPPPRPAAAHQPGVLGPGRAAFTLAAFDVQAQNRVELADTLRALSSPVPNASVTVAVGASLFKDRFDLYWSKPRQLERMPEFRNDVLAPEWCHGDLLVQVLADTPEAARAALARPVPGLAPRWRIDGFQSQDSRNLFGFREGAGNPDTSNAAAMDDLVWVGPDDDEPEWCVGGSYLVVRLIRLAMPTWDRKTTEEQEQVFGRRKESDIPLGKSEKDGGLDLPKMPVDAHVRRAAESGGRRILRRSYSYRRSAEDTGQIFTCYQRDLKRGFETVQRGLAGEALERYVMPFGGGYFFVLPGPRTGTQEYVGQRLINAG